MNELDARKIEQLKSENSELDHLFTELENEQHLVLSNVSHELRNILTLVLSSVQLIENAHPEAKTYTYWNETMSDLQHMKNLLIAFSNYNNGKKVELTQIDLYQFLEDLYHSMIPFFNEKRQKLSFSTSGSHTIMEADYTKLKQAIINLLKNASEATPEGQHIEMIYSNEQNHVEISIRDTGNGISEEQMKTLFQPFVTSKPSGSGLGLPLTKRIIESHGGRLHILSKEGEGTTCTIIFPTSPLASDT